MFLFRRRCGAQALVYWQTTPTIISTQQFRGNFPGPLTARLGVLARGTVGLEFARVRSCGAGIATHVPLRVQGFVGKLG